MILRPYKRLHRENQEFNREILLRNEKVYTALIAQLEKSTGEMSEQIRLNTEQLRLNTERMKEETEQTRANTQAVLRMLDKIDGRGGD